MADFERLEGKIDSLAAKVEGVNVLVASMMPRAEVEAVAARRVSLDTYAADQRATNERLLRLEASPARLLAWLAVGTGCLGTFISLLMGGFFILEFVLTHYKP